jgi:hypothetical protein
LKQLLLLCNLASFVVLLIGTFVFFLVPALLTRLGLDVDSGRILLMQFISFLLLLGSFQKNLSWGWRRFSLGASFIVLAQSLLVAIMVHGIG